MFLSVNLQFFWIDKKVKMKCFRHEFIGISLYVTQCNI